MARTRAEAKTWTASQVVAHNLTCARVLRGMTQAEIAERLTRLTGTNWSQATVAQAEGSVTGSRVRQFTANELVALARTFDLPVLYFFLPPEDGARALETPDSPAKGWSWEYLLLLLWGHAKNFPIVADRAAPWAHASTMVTVPADDVLEPRPDGALLADLSRQRERYTPEDMLAVAFNGLARRRMRGATKAGDDVSSLVGSLRGLADALEAFANYRPGTFLKGDEVRQAAERKHRRTKGEDDG
jgi:transcriptional regulator with XRE-family HTH domain